jgi:hypothetical protein
LIRSQIAVLQKKLESERSRHSAYGGGADLSG